MIVHEYKIAMVNSDLAKLLEMLDISDNRRWRLLRFSTAGGRSAALLERVKAGAAVDENDPI
jgi:hypothetical protein